LQCSWTLLSIIRAYLISSKTFSSFWLFGAVDDLAIWSKFTLPDICTLDCLGFGIGHELFVLFEESLQVGRELLTIQSFPLITNLYWYSNFEYSIGKVALKYHLFPFFYKYKSLFFQALNSPATVTLLADG